MGQIWAVNSLGGYAYSDNLSADLRTQVQPSIRWRQLCDAKDAIGKGKGEAWHWNIYSDVTDDGTIGGTGISETEEIPVDNFTITQGTGTITEFGRAVPYSGKLDDLSEQPVKEIIRKVLKNHCAKSLDRAAFTEFAKCPLRVAVASATVAVATDLTINGTATATNSVALDKGHVNGIVDIMKERNIPQYGSGDYLAIGWPTTFRTLKNSLESIHTYVESGIARIMNGEMGRYGGVRFIEQTGCPKGTGSTADAAWTNSLSDWAFFMGEDTVAEGISIPEEIRGKIPTDFGRSRGVAWYALLGYSLVHTTSTGTDNARILMWDSAA